MTDIAQMRFRSVSAPEQYGIMALSDDGTFRIVPSDEFRDEMARLEEVALHRSQTFGVRTGLVLLILGALALGVGWFLGRVFGKLGSSLSTPRSFQEVSMTHDENGIVRVTLHGLENRWQVIQMAWHADEVLQPEAQTFVAKLEELKQSGKAAQSSEE